MSHRFLPWVRSGLAAEVAEVDNQSTDIPSRASFGVTLDVSGSGASAQTDLRLYGPGDVLGIDTRTIIRTEPKPRIGDFPPDLFASIEFDPPDFPWMFTPASAGPNNRLRPWLVLVVVRKQEGVDIQVDGTSPLPKLEIAHPADPSVELPDLSESWAWAHAQLVNDGAPADGDDLAADPNRNLSRLLCPRRLEPDVDYIACLVPAFEHGRLGGLGLPIPEDATTTGPSWPSTPGPTVNLPLYYHWEFRTGAAGDFESLARKLGPVELPDEVGSRPMYIGAADPALPVMAATESGGGIVGLEGALRSPEVGSGTPLTSAHTPLVDALTTLLDAGAEHIDTGASVGANRGLPAENVAPPIYGSWHVATHRIPDRNRRPRWLRELNVDPRHRSAAGLGTEVVKANQERYMDAAWEQVGDVIAANAALDRARAMRLVAQRMMERHFLPLAPNELATVTSPVHPRALHDGKVLGATIEFSTLPTELGSPALRRMLAPHNARLTRAARLTDAPIDAAGNIQIGVLDTMAQGEFRVDLGRPVDGISGSRLLEKIPSGGTLKGELFGLSGSLNVEQTKAVMVAANNAAGTVPQKLEIRRDLQMTGIILRDQIDRIGSHLAGSRSVSGALAEIETLRGEHPDAVGFTIPERLGPIGVLAVNEAGDTLVVRDESGARNDVARLGPEVTRRGVNSLEAVRDVVGRLGVGALDGIRSDGRRPVRLSARRPVGIDPGLELDVLTPVPSDNPLITVASPIKDRVVITEYMGGLELLLKTSDFQVASKVPELAPINLTDVGSSLLDQIDPEPTLLARVEERIQIGGLRPSGGIATDRVFQAAPLAPVMIGPRFDEPLYGALAEYDQDRFLPGAGLIPANSISLLETNPQFIEAFMVGANHEMNRELLWRSYPTDRRGTPFRSFWERLDGGTDIGPIDAFNGGKGLGRNSIGAIEGSLVLLVRGDLLRRYPNSIVYAAPAGSDRLLEADPAEIRFPVFSGILDPDITFVGFDLTVEEISPEPGWFFVIQEQPTEPRFGLDVPTADSSSGVPPNWASLTWASVDVDPGGYLPLSALPGTNRSLSDLGAVNARWGRNSAHMASITFQRTFRAAIHSSEVLDSGGS